MRFLLRMLGVGLALSAIAVACGGSDFSSENAPKGTGGAAGASARGGTSGDSGAAGDMSAAGTLGSAGTQSAGGTGAMGGSGGGGTVLCSDAKDCDDENNCTLDVCLASGVCDNPPKCEGENPVCCDGTCSKCCGQDDCDDGIDCTDNSCFAGQCNFLPSERCGDGFYCSTDVANAPSGCLPVEDCDVAGDCDDGNPCTQDACVDHKCAHPTCPEGGSCCPGLGCGECCGDSQCPQDDPCKPSTCTGELKCATSSLCDDGDKCCMSGDGKSASCGACCEATDCEDDGVVCTDEKCKSVEGFFKCSHEPNADNCPMGQDCDPRADCTANECNGTQDCAAPPLCKTVSCDSGSCTLHAVDCSHSQECCSLTGECQDCCVNKDCDEPGLNRCCMPGGTCAECCDDSDCQLAMTTGAPTPQALVGGADVPCPGPSTCKVGKCVGSSEFCTATEKCCAGVGCVPLLQLVCPAMTD